MLPIGPRQAALIILARRRGPILSLQCSALFTIYFVLIELLLKHQTMNENQE